MSGHRQSALLLHGLGKADRRWILSQLHQDDAQLLDRHLAELKDLGIPADPALGARNSRAMAAQGSAGAVHGASAAAMQLLLAQEPAWMVRHLLALGPWPWRDAFLDSLAPPQRERLAGAGCPPLRAEASERLLAAVAGKLAARPSVPHAAPAAGLMQSLRQSLRRWM
jgi:hypothetical protein